MIGIRPQYSAHLPDVPQWAHHAKNKLHWALLSELDPLENPTPTRPTVEPTPPFPLRRCELVGGDVDPDGSMASPHKYDADADALSEASIAPPLSGMPPRRRRTPQHGLQQPAEPDSVIR